MMQEPKVLLIGLGGFGKNHFAAWQRMGMLDRLWVVDTDPAKLDLSKQAGVLPARLGTDARAFLPQVDVVDVVVPTDTHHAVCMMALDAGKDVFVEKPMALNLEQSEGLAAKAERNKRLIQVGYYYRYHPASRYCKTALRRGELGDLRYLAGDFLGFKRARTDVGVTHTDAVHFLDLFNWLAGDLPTHVSGHIRDHWGRKMENLSLMTLEYEHDVLARIESGYIQPGKWRDKVVPDAFTSKDIDLIGSKGALEVDFETERLVHHRVEHKPRQGTWWPSWGETTVPALPTSSPVEMVQAELTAFLEAVKQRAPKGPGPFAAGVANARIMEAFYTACRTRTSQELEWSPADRRLVAAEGPGA